MLSKQQDAASLDRVRAALVELSDAAHKIEDQYNADEYDGNLDESELEAETIWKCCRRISAAIDDLPTPEAQ